MFFENILIHLLIFCFLCWFEYTDVGNVKIRGFKKIHQFWLDANSPNTPWVGIC